MVINGILFDKDGTLLDFNKSWMPVNRIAAMTVAGGDPSIAGRLLKECGQNEAAGYVESGAVLAAGNTGEIAAAWEQLHPDHGIIDLVGVIDEIFQREGATSAVPVPDLQKVLSKLHGQGLTLGIATSDSHQGAIASLTPFDILDKFNYIAGYDSGHGVKPGPGMVEGFCQSTGLIPDEIIVVGDNPHDLEMGKSGGAGLLVGVLSGTSRHEDLAPLADEVINGITAISEIIDKYQ